MKSGLTNIRILLTALNAATPVNAVRVAEKADLTEGCPSVLVTLYLEQI